MCEPRVSTQFIEMSGTRSYAVAPITAASRVIGFLHADYHPSDQLVDAVDRDVLGVVADDVSRVYERTAMLDRLHTRRAHMQDTLRDIELSMTRVAATVDGFAAAAFGASEDPAGGEAPETIRTASLTAREREILSRVVIGRSNRQIADELVISEGTVKTHVKHLLRKFTVANRSELIARWAQREEIG
jgi:DNA-binding CsgD family transcriptional regulator